MPDRQSSPGEATEHPETVAGPGQAGGVDATADAGPVTPPASAPADAPAAPAAAANGAPDPAGDATTSLFEPSVPYQGQETFAAGAAGAPAPGPEQPTTPTPEPGAAASGPAAPSLEKKPAAAGFSDGETVRVPSVTPAQAVPAVSTPGAATDDSPTTALPVPAGGSAQQQSPQRADAPAAGTEPSTTNGSASTSKVAPATAAPAAGDDARTTTWDSEATQVIPIGASGQRPPAGGDSPTERIRVPHVAAAAAAAGADAPTRVGGPVGGPGGPGGFGGGPGYPPAAPSAPPAPPAPPSNGGGDFSGDGTPPRRRRRGLLVGAVVVGLLALLYIGDLLLSNGSVPRGVTVAGVPVGGLDFAAAEQRLRSEIEPRTTLPIPVAVGEVTAELDPATAGLAVDWAATLREAGEQPYNPITRITSLFTSRDVPVVTESDPEALTAAVGELAPVVNREPVEGTVRFEGTTPVAVDPVPGQELDQAGAIATLENEWVDGALVTLPLVTLPAATTPEDVAEAIENVATPAVSGPVTVIGEENLRATLQPGTIAEALAFQPVEGGGLEPVLNQAVITDALTPQLAGSEQEARDATFDFATTPPTIVPSQDGRGVDYEATLADLLTVLTGEDEREITAVYSEQPAEVTTESLEALGNPEMIGTFTTGGFATDSGRNIRRAAELVNGTVVQPGETFSLDEVTGPRDASNGYVEAGVIDNGRAGRGIAGGVSQVSTTLYNAAYFAGMTDIEHRAHSFYISRYPPGREATIATGAIDMRWRNDSPGPVLIRTAWTPSNVTVELYGTKEWEVTSTPGPRTNPTEPNTVNVPAGEQCSASNGAPGFTITDTRTMTNVNTGEVRTETNTTRYNPVPRVVCGG